MIDEVLHDAEDRMKGAISALEGDLQGYRTGRASPHLLDRLVIEMFEVEMPLHQVATVSVPEPQQLAIRPFDQSYLKPIEKAIQKSDLGLTPNNDGKIIRLNIPRLTEERRRDLQKQIGKRIEEARVAVRNVRRDALNDLREFKNESLISEDEFERGEKTLNDLTEHYVKERVDNIGKEKEAEIMKV